MPDSRMNASGLFTMGYMIAELCGCPYGDETDEAGRSVPGIGGLTLNVDCVGKGPDHGWKPGWAKVSRDSIAPLGGPEYL